MKISTLFEFPTVSSDTSLNNNGGGQGAGLGHGRDQHFLENEEPDLPKVLNKNDKPAGEIGKDDEGKYYLKHYASNLHKTGFNSYDNALGFLRNADLRYNPNDANLSPQERLMKNPTYKEGYNDGLKGQRNPRASSIFGPESNKYEDGYKAGQIANQQGVTEGINESTVSGAIASVSSGVGGAQRRNASIYNKTSKKGSGLLSGIKTSKKYANSVNEDNLSEEQIYAKELQKKIDLYKKKNKPDFFNKAKDKEIMTKEGKNLNHFLDKTKKELLINKLLELGIERNYIAMIENDDQALVDAYREMKANIESEKHNKWKTAMEAIKEAGAPAPMTTNPVRPYDLNQPIVQSEVYNRRRGD